MKSSAKFEKSFRTGQQSAFAREFGERVRVIRKRLGLSQAELAEKLLRANSDAVSRIERGSLKAMPLDMLAALVTLAEEAGRTVEWLMTGEAISNSATRDQILMAAAKMILRDDDRSDTPKELIAEAGRRIESRAEAAAAHRVIARIEPGYRTVEPEQLPADWAGRFVPVIGVIAAGDNADTDEADAFEPGDAAAYLEYAGAPGCFAVRVAGDSMQPTYADGDMVVVNPAIRPRSGVCCVITAADGHRIPRLKKLILRKGAARLESLNPKYPPVDVPAHTVHAFGVVAHLPLMKEVKE